MSAKELLSKVKEMDLLIDEKLQDVQGLRDRLTNVTASYEGERVQTSMQGDKFAETVAKIVDLEEKINSDVDALIKHKEHARELIEKIDNDVLKAILYKRYFRGYTFEEIAVEIGYSWRHTCRLHGIALQKLNRVIECHTDKGV